MKTTLKKMFALGAFFLMISTVSAQDADANGKVDCHCFAIDNYKVTFDNCQLDKKSGFCFGWCEYVNKTYPWMIFASNMNCTDVADPDPAKDAVEYSLYNYNRNLNIEIGTPVSTEREISVPLNLEGTNGTVMKYDVVNSFGKTVKSNYTLAAGVTTLKIDSRDLAHGVYALKFEVNGQVINKNFVL